MLSSDKPYPGYPGWRTATKPCVSCETGGILWNYDDGNRDKWEPPHDECKRCDPKGWGYDRVLAMTAEGPRYG